MGLIAPVIKNYGMRRVNLAFSRHLQGRIAVVTGGAGGDSGLGLTTTEALLRCGARVVVWDAMTAAIDRARVELQAEGLDAEFLQVDVTDREQVRAAYAWVLDKLGPVDVLVNNAALKMAHMLGPKGSRRTDSELFWNLDVDRFRRILDVNVVGPFITASVVVPGMLARQRGSIVNVVTSSSTQRSAKHIPYGPSKAGLEAMTQAMAAQLQGRGVRMNAVLPGESASPRGQSLPDHAPYDAWLSQSCGLPATPPWM